MGQPGKLYVTEAEFVTRMVEKGKDRPWATAEFARRRGTCPDTGLPTVQMHEGPMKIYYRSCPRAFRCVV